MEVIKMTDKELFDELSYKRENAYEKMSDAEKKDMLGLCDEYREFLDEGKTERECVAKAIEMAEKEGFVNIDDVEKIKCGNKL